MVKPAHPRTLYRSCSGATAVEFALVALPFIALIVGMVEVSRVVMTHSVLQFAVEKAARCAALNTSLCGTTLQVQGYANAQMPGYPSDVTVFTHGGKQACGTKVSGQTTFSFAASSLLPLSLTLKAASCYPS